MPTPVRKIISFNLLFFFSIVLLMEFGARVYYSFKGIPLLSSSTENVSTIYNHSHPYLPVALRKNSSFENDPDISINNVGFRGPAISLPKAENSIRIAVIGGSAVWGISGPNVETWPRVLEAKLREKFPERIIEVINAGVPGYNSMESQINFIIKIIPLDIDILVVYQAYNDMKGIMRATTFEPDYSDWRGRDNPHHTPYRFFQKYSRFYFGMDRFLKKINKKKQRKEKAIRRNLDPRLLEFYKQNIFNIVSLAKANNIIPVLSTFNLALDSKYIHYWSSLGIQSDQYKELLDKYNQVIKDLSASADIQYVDIEEILDDDESIHSDIVHFTKLGKEKMGTFFAEELEEVIKAKVL